MKTVSAWIEQQVLRTPDAIAVVFDGQAVTYQDLNSRANHLAAQLRHLNPQPDMQIALCMERSVEQIVSIVAILKVGCAYVPLDPSQPIQRLNKILNEGNISSIIITADEQRLFSDYQGTCILVNDKKSSPCENPSSVITPENLAYVIYTSGTTGTPKGVLIEHRSVVNFCQWFATFSGASAAQRIDWSGNYIFDMTVSTSIVPLMLGMTIVMCTDEIKKDPAAYLRYVKANNINIIELSASYFKELLREAIKHPIELPDVQTVVLGGERLLTADCRSWLSQYPEHVLFNEYGPTEATIAVTQQKICKANIDTFATYITIGRPGTNMSCYILNTQNKPVPPGETGELHIGGVCLARGYINQPELTNEKFISCSFQPEQVSRLYKTGDLCRQLPDKSIEFLGRIDQQIKLRGYRIEPGEIEMCLRKHPTIQDAIVITYEHEPHEPRLVAYCIMKNNNLTLDYVHIRTHLQHHLPDYMIPNSFVKIDHFPLTANSKLDYHALPPPSLSSGENYIAPESELEKKLASIWSKELGVCLIGIQDNFFELGGHSLNAARIVSEINQTLKKNVSIHAFYSAENISTLAALISSAISATSAKPRYIEKSSKTIPLGDFQLLLWMLKTFEPKARKLNVVSRKRLQTQLDYATLNSAFRTILKRHSILSYRTRIFYPAQYQQADRDFSITEIKLTDFSIQESEKRLVTSVNELISFNGWSKQYPQLIAKIFYLHDGAMELQICLPHLISDEASIHILWNDLSTFYHAELTKESPQVEQTHSFNDYIVSEKQKIEANFEKDGQFWENYFHNTGFFLFPSEQIVKNIKSSGLTYSTYQSIFPNVLTGLEQYCARHQVSLNAVLCAAVSISLNSAVPTQENNMPILMNVVKSTRDNPVWDQTIGCFLRLDPIKVSINHADTLLSISKQIHHTMIETTKHMHASTILKLAYMNVKNSKRKLNWLIQSLLTVYTKILNIFDLQYKSLHLIPKLSCSTQINEFVICINLRNNFIKPITQNEKSVWGKEQPIQLHKHDLENFDNVCDITFMRDDDQTTPYVVVSSNLQPDFRKRISTEIINVVSQALD